MRGPAREPTLEEFKPEIDEALAEELGAMTAVKMATIVMMFTPVWRVKALVRRSLMKQAAVEEHEEERTRTRQRDLDQEKYRRIVDGRTSGSTA